MAGVARSWSVPTLAQKAARGDTMRALIDQCQPADKLRDLCRCYDQFGWPGEVTGSAFWSGSGVAEAIDARYEDGALNEHPANEMVRDYVALGVLAESWDHGLCTQACGQDGSNVRGDGFYHDRDDGSIRCRRLILPRLPEHWEPPLDKGRFKRRPPYLKGAHCPDCGSDDVDATQFKCQKCLCEFIAPRPPRVPGPAEARGRAMGIVPLPTPEPAAPPEVTTVTPTPEPPKRNVTHHDTPEPEPAAPAPRAITILPDGTPLFPAEWRPHLEPAAPPAAPCFLDGRVGAQGGNHVPPTESPESRPKNGVGAPCALTGGSEWVGGSPQALPVKVPGNAAPTGESAQPAAPRLLLVEKGQGP